MIARAEWFRLNPIGPKTWQGWMYSLAVVAIVVAIGISFWEDSLRQWILYCIGILVALDIWHCWRKTFIKTR